MIGWTEIERKTWKGLVLLEELKSGPIPGCFKLDPAALENLNYKKGLVALALAGVSSDNELRYLVSELRRDILGALEANKGEDHWVLRRVHRLLPTVEDFQKT